MKNYTTSKDYEKLWKLVQDGKEIVCFTHGLSTYVSIAMKQGKYVAVFSRGVGDIETNSEIDFIQTCKKLNLEFLPPDAWIKIESDKDLPPKRIFVLGVAPDKIVEVVHWTGERWCSIRFYWEKEKIIYWKPMPQAPEVEA